MKSNKYEQVNLITFFAMIMVATQHYLLYLGGNFHFVGSSQVVNVLQGFSRPAVDLFVLNIGYSNIYLNKSVKFDRVLLYVILPTIFLTAFNNYVFSANGGFTFTLSWGFAGSWFGDMYVGLMFLVPLCVYGMQKNKNFTVFVGIIVWILSFILSVYWHENKLDNTGVLVGIFYIGIIIPLTYFTLFFKNPSKILLWITFILCGVIETLSYGGSIAHTLIQSYFSPITLLETYSFFLIIYNSNWKIPKLRNLTRSSYFYYFLSYTLIKFFEATNARNLFVGNYPIISYILVIFGGMVLSYIVFAMYTKLLDIMKINEQPVI